MSVHVLKQCVFLVSRLSPRAADDAIREEAHHDVSPLPLPDAGGLDWNNLVHTATKAFTGNRPDLFVNNLVQTATKASTGCRHNYSVTKNL